MFFDLILRYIVGCVMNGWKMFNLQMLKEVEIKKKGKLERVDKARFLSVFNTF